MLRELGFLVLTTLPRWRVNRPGAGSVCGLAGGERVLTLDLAPLDAEIFVALELVELGGIVFRGRKPVA
jgi:hypothetical protein